ncbi:MAG: DNA repair protein RecN [Gammaproteobacteria bacterium]|nr:DNA repair protein RecN [Gammaproteobacteria bacterium]NNM10579.1 DNA repair protein RecN [Pseudomonadales bacterium]
MASQAGLGQLPRLPCLPNSINKRFNRREISHMLSDLSIRNFTTVDELELDFGAGLSIITGETGAGKSVMLDALALALGGKTQKQTLRDESRTAELSAAFLLQKDDLASSWLAERELLDGDQVVCRRVLKPDGRSRAFINGSAVNISELRQLAPLLLDLHGQHEQQTLLDKSKHRALLDAFGKHEKLASEVAELAQGWNQLQQRIDKLLQASSSGDARKQLLAYQVQELENLKLGQNELKQLEAEHKVLANAEGLLAQLQQLQEICSGESVGTGLADLSQQANRQLADCCNTLPELKNALGLIESARIQIDEALVDINAAAEGVQINPERLQEVESRLDLIYSVARKHNTQATSIPALHIELAAELEALQNGEDLAEKLREQQQELEARYAKSAGSLSKKRKSAATKLETAVANRLTELQMKHCQFVVALAPRESGRPLASGTESIEFLISTVPGKSAQPLAKVASGGELSRISLAIQVSTAQTSATPTLVFDEVDVGISGAVAEVVGNLLRELGNSSQVICVTHLPQVAAKGSQHLLVTKQLSKRSASTEIKTLDKDARRAELARMLGGLDVTESTLAHAAEMLDTA